MICVLGEVGMGGPSRALGGGWEGTQPVVKVGWVAGGLSGGLGWGGWALRLRSSRKDLNFKNSLNSLKFKSPPGFLNFKSPGVLNS